MEHSVNLSPLLRGRRDSSLDLCRTLRGPRKTTEEHNQKHTISLTVKIRPFTPVLENPVGSPRQVKGFLYGLEFDWLQTSGPDSAQTKGTASASAIEAISNSMFFGNVLPNVQFTMGWGF